ALPLKKQKAVKIIEISDNNTDKASPLPWPLLKKPKHKTGVDLTFSSSKQLDIKCEPEIIDLTCKKVGPKSSKLKSAARNPAAKIKIMTSKYVDEIIRLEKIPSHWSPSKVPKAYLIDLSVKRDILKDKKKSIIGLIWANDQLSWDSSSGHVTGDVDVHDAFPGAQSKVYCQHAQLKCQSIKLCELFDCTCLAGYESFDMGKSDMKNFWAEELNANEQDSHLVLGAEARFYTHVVEMKCEKENCKGRPSLLRLMV
ncbi:hypothetical protein H0H81_004168, partial [Sphagnurus paluster]